jgi:hypothetical protein
VVQALHGVNVGRRPPNGQTPIYEVLCGRRAEPVGATLDELRERAEMVFAAYGLPIPDLAAPAQDIIQVEALDLPAEFDRFEEATTASGLRVLHSRLTDLVVPHDQFFRTRAA